jgi:small-conductance mechanosensitive channel
MLEFFDSFVWRSWLGLAAASLIAIVAVVIAVGVIMLIVRAVARHRPGIYAALAPIRRRFRLLLALAALWIAVDATLPMRDWLGTIDHAFLIAIIAVSAWLLMGVITLAINRALVRYPIDVPDNRVARRVRTQMLIVRRLAMVVIGVIAAGSILLTFPGAQAAGASLLASAGLVSVVAGLAAQTALANVFAGMQLAFSDAIRVDDVVIADGEWGRIEEITLTYVVVSIWDQRRLVLPSTYFTTTPFQNWTRKGSELLGAVELDLDWRVSPSAMRDQLTSVVEATQLWDGRVANVQVTDATGGHIRVRLLVSAADAGSLWDLRCLVREEMVEWMQKKSPAALPRNRVIVVDKEAQSASVRTRKDADERGVFSGSPEAEARGKEFTGSIPVQSKAD